MEKIVTDLRCYNFKLRSNLNVNLFETKMSNIRCNKRMYVLSLN